jgi:hypothetical protein
VVVVRTMVNVGVAITANSANNSYSFERLWGRGEYSPNWDLTKPKTTQILLQLFLKHLKMYLMLIHKRIAYPDSNLSFRLNLSYYLVLWQWSAAPCNNTLHQHAYQRYGF